MKRIIIYLSFLSLMNLEGCYYQQQMITEEYSFADNADIQVTTKDTVYKFNSEDYYYYSDTLFASVTKPLDEKTNLRYTISIPVENIEKIEVEKTDVFGTSLIVLGVLVGVFALVVASAMGSGLH